MALALILVGMLIGIFVSFLACLFARAHSNNQPRWQQRTVPSQGSQWAPAATAVRVTRGMRGQSCCHDQACSEECAKKSSALMIASATMGAQHGRDLHKLAKLAGQIGDSGKLYRALEEASKPSEPSPAGEPEESEVPVSPPA